jgi:hypothetical protein
VRGAIRSEPNRASGDSRSVNARALTLAIRLLSTSAAAAVGLTGCCGLFYEPWETESIELGTDADLHAMAELSGGSFGGRYVAVGAGGTVVVWSHEYNNGNIEPVVELSSVGDADLRAIWVDESAWWVVGDGGMVAVSDDDGLTWTTVDLGTTSNLHGIIRVGSRLVVVGDDVVFVQASDGTWSEILAPEGSWGQLRAVYSHDSHVYAVGRSGVIWSTPDPSGEWIAESSGVDVDLFDVGFYRDYANGDEQIAVVGAEGTLLMGTAAGEWVRVETHMKTDLIGYDSEGVLAADGRVFEMGEKRKLVQLDTFAGARALVYAFGNGAAVVGADGLAAEKNYYPCKGGRPFVVDGEPHTASLCGDTREPLAATWARNGLDEHASVASFARFGLELLALGVPPRLLREVQAAIQDELVHARLCFELARRFGGVEVSPGAMPMPTRALARTGDPVATALALFEEGCINESRAACEAARAAAACDDAEVREVLERIAADEFRHARLAWDALQWLLDTYGERVRGPLRARLARSA